MWIYQGVLWAVWKSIQQLLRRVQRSNESRDEHGFAADVDDGGETGPVVETMIGLFLEDLTCHQQALHLLTVKLTETWSEVIYTDSTENVLLKTEYF